MLGMPPTPDCFNKSPRSWLYERGGGGGGGGGGLSWGI